MAWIAPSSTGSSPFQNLMGHHPEVLQNWNALESAFFASETFTPELKEEVRRSLAHINQCQYCMAKGKPSENITDPKIAAAVAFAKNLQVDAVLKSEFNDAEISELCAFICFISASQKFGASLGLEASCAIH